MEIIGVKMHEIEFRGLLNDSLELKGVVDERVGIRFIRAKRSGTDGNELCRRHGIARSEERDIVTHFYEFFGEIGNDAFRAAISVRRDAFIERRDLGDAQGKPPVSVRETWMERTPWGRNPTII